MERQFINSSGIKWRWGVLAALGVTLISLFPQIHLWIKRGSGWQGAYSVMHPDELLYSAYVNALIDGRPRKNDPFTGRDEQHESPAQPESHLSIQFIPAYAIALPARWWGMTASTAFIMLRALAACASSFAIFWLLATVTGNERVAMAGVFFSLCLGTFAGHQGVGWALLGDNVSFLYLAFLRCYPVAVAFPLFFVHCTLVWKALIAERRRPAIIYSAMAGLSFAILIYSYLFIWTAAAAWVACVFTLWLLARPANWISVIRTFAILCSIATGALLPYIHLLSRRSQTVDNVQTIVTTHAPDVFRLPELGSALILAVLWLNIKRAVINWRDPLALLTLSFALLPFAVFNQQIITGRVAQPFHYELFITNYVVLVGAVLAAALLWRTRQAIKLPVRLIRFIALASLLWGIVEVAAPVFLMPSLDESFDRAVPVARRLRELARSAASESVAQSEQQKRPAMVVLSTDINTAMLIPTFAPQAAAWTPFDVVLPNVTPLQHKERYFAFLYYCGVSGGELRQALNHNSASSDLNRYSRYALFGHERVHDYLDGDARPLTQQEVDEAVREFEMYCASFYQERAELTRLSYLVVPSDATFDFSRIDRWYQRSAPENHGSFNLYRLRSPT